MTIKVTLHAGQRMSYHSHQYRDEIWIVTSGEGETVVDDMRRKIKVGDVITLAAGCCHTVMAGTEMKLIEVQLGKDIDAHDKKKHDLLY